MTLQAGNGRQIAGGIIRNATVLHRGLAWGNATQIKTTVATTAAPKPTTGQLWPRK